MTDYSALILADLAKKQGDQSARDIEASTMLGFATVRKCLKLLQKAGLVASKRGAEGGYALTRAFADITVLELLLAIEGHGAVSLTDCHHQLGQCQLEAHCSMRHRWLQLSNILTDFLGRVTLADLDQHRSTLNHVPLPTLTSLEDHHHVND